MNCRCCNHPVEELHQPIQRRDGDAWQTIGLIYVQTCKNPDCALYNYTIDHRTVDLARYHATQHPDWELTT
jgi:hypothetical protein